MTILAAVSSDESTVLILCTLEWSPTQFSLEMHNRKKSQTGKN